MKKCAHKFPRRSAYARAALTLFLITALPQIAPAPVAYRTPDITTGLTTEYTLLSIELSYPAIGHWTNTVQFSPDLIQWSAIDAVTPPADGTVSLQYFYPLSTTKAFFRLGIPQVQINFVQPFTILNSGGSFYLVGQVFDPSYTVWIDGNLVSSTFIDSSTIQVNVGPLSAGFYDIAIRDSMNNVVATLSHGLQVTTTGRNDQESPPRAPLVNLPPLRDSLGAGTYDVVFCPTGAYTADQCKVPSPFSVWIPSKLTLCPTPAAVVCGVTPESPRKAVIQEPFVAGGDHSTVGPLWVDPHAGYFGGDTGETIPPPEPGKSVYIPEVWRIDPVPWNRDVAPQNKIDDLIDADSGVRHDIIVDFRDVALPKLEPLFAVPSVNEATGEVFVSSIDLIIPGRGLDFVWGRTYRSKIGMDTAMGVGWDFSYNIRAAQSGPNITVQDGQNRTDTYFLQGDGSFSNDELFRRGTMAGPVFMLQFADKTNWIFRAFDGSPAAGKIAQIVDRNSNQLQFQYDPGSGRLMSIIDSLGRPFTLNYVPAGPLAGRLQAVQDFSGRAILYQHHNGGGPGGSLGDLLMVRSPIVNGTPNGNDFPSGKTAQFTYSSGFGDAARNHNLLTVRDGLNVQWFQATYAPTAVATDFLYDRIASYVVGTAGEMRVFTYLPKTPNPGNRFNTTKTIVNDAVGNVHESLFDSKNRLIDLRQFTGRSTPGVAVTENTNRPINPVRLTDPPFFVTTIDWNRDSLPTRVTLPRGNGVEMIYERDFDPATNPRLRANLRVHRQLPVTGAPLVHRFEHASGFGTRECFASRLMEEEGIYYGLEGDPDMPIITGSVYNSFRPEGNAVNYISGHGGDNHSRPMESISFSLATDPSGLSATGMCVSSVAPINIDQPHGSTDSFGTSHTDARGFTWTCARDANGNVISLTRPDGVTTDIEHNANGQLTAIVWPQNNTGHRERDELHYLNGYLQSLVRDTGGLNLTTAFTRDPVGNVVQIVDPRGRDAQFFVNQLNQVVQVTSRDVGSGIRYLTNVFRDANNRVTSFDVQNKDEFGNVGTPAFFTTSFGYDPLDHVTSMTRTVDSGHTVTTQYFYNAIRDLIEVRSPLAVTAAQPDARVQYADDERNLPFTRTAAPGSPNATRSTYSYDPNGNLNKIETGAPAGPQHTTTAIYDGFDRIMQRTDPVGTQVQFGYNSNHQPTQMTVVGTFLDNSGTPTTGTLTSRSWVYAPTGICTGRIDSFFDIIIQVPILDGARTTTYSYDLALNLTGVTDDNSHLTQCSYDGANRLSRVTDPKGNRVDYAYDANSNVVVGTRTDKSDTAAPDQAFTGTYVYDGLDRLVTATDNVGNVRTYSYDSRSNRVRGVDPRNNLTQYEYDGLNRLLRSGQDMNANSSGFDPNDIVHTYSYDDNSRLVSSADPNLHAMQYQYDPLGRRIQRTNADNTVKIWSYDPWGNALQTNDENGTLCLNTYDNLNRLKQRQITPGAGVSNATTFELYDYPGAYLRVERAINDAGAVRYTYDSLGHVLSEKLNNRTTTYTYDGVGNMLSMQSPGGRVLAYSYDTANLLTALNLTATGDGDSLGQIVSYQYIGRRVESSTHRNGTSTAYTYDGFVGAPAGPDLGWGRIASSLTLGPGSTVIDQRTFTYDAAGNLSERNDTRAGGPQLLHHYDYDAANRNVHTQVNAPGPTLVRDTIYNYDLNGNRIVVNGFATPNPGVYIQDATTPSPADAQMNQYTSTPLGSYSYDANGNRTNLNGGGGNRDYKYDYANRLVDLTDLNTTLRIANYQYDALGRRIQKTLDPDGTPNTTNFVYTGRTVLEERDGGGAVTAAYSLKPFVTDWGMDPIWGALSPNRISSWEHQYEYASDRFPMGESEIWWFSFARVQGETQDAYYSFAPAEMRRGGTNYAYHAEVVPWPWFLTNVSGGTAERYEYEDFGDPHFFDGSGAPLPSSAIGNPYLFKGMRFDGESGLYAITIVPSDRGPIRLVNKHVMFDPKIGASLQRESSHAVNAWSMDVKIEGQNVYYVDPSEWDPGQPIQIPIDP